MRLAVLLACSALAFGAGSASAAAKFQRVSTAAVGNSSHLGFVRSGDGTLHVVWAETQHDSGMNGLGEANVSASGSLGPVIQAIPGWQPGLPGLIQLPNGSLEAVFGAISPAPENKSSVWGTVSSDGGHTWAAPTDVKGGGPNEALAYGSDVTAVMAGTTPVLTLPQAGGLVVQQGLGPGSPSQQVNSNSNGSVGGVETAVDAAASQAVASWNSLNASADFVQTVAPTLGMPQQIPGQEKNFVVLAGRDTGAGVFGAFTADGTKVSLFRYGGGSVTVGKAKGVTAKVLGVATGPDGRIWVMWGDDSNEAVTRSNTAVTRFEPIQHIANATSTLFHLEGDGRLGPLDLFADEIPLASGGSIPPAGSFYTRVLPVMSASASSSKVKSKGKVVGHKLTVKVTDAGDAVAGAKVKALGKSATTGTNGVAKLKLGAAGGHATLTVKKTGYATLSRTIKI